MKLYFRKEEFVKDIIEGERVFIFQRFRNIEFIGQIICVDYRLEQIEEWKFKSQKEKRGMLRDFRLK